MSVKIERMRYTGIKEKCWQVIRRICEVRDGNKCYTCPVQGEDVMWNAGHYRTVATVGSNNTRCWDVRFIRRQCSRCNGAGQGEQARFREHLVKDLGEAVVAEYDQQVVSKAPSPVRNWDVLLESLKAELELQKSLSFG